MFSILIVLIFAKKFEIVFKSIGNIENSIEVRYTTCICFNLLRSCRL
jgi:hypothetical protein